MKTMASVAHMKQIKACSDARAWFAATYGDAAVPLAQVLRALAEHESGPDWVRWYSDSGHLPATARTAYDAAIATAWTAYDAAIAPARTAYDAVRQAAIVTAAEALETEA